MELVYDKNVVFYMKKRGGMICIIYQLFNTSIAGMQHMSVVTFLHILYPNPVLLGSGFRSNLLYVCPSLTHSVTKLIFPTLTLQLKKNCF